MAGDPTQEPAAAIVQGLADRLRSLLLALDRHDRLESSSEFVGWLGRERREGRLPGAAREVLLRALRAASDPLNFRILELLHPVDGIGLAEVMRATGLERVAASERVNDLVQAGLAGRELIDDHIRGTPLSAGVVELVRGLSEAAGEQLAGDLAPTVAVAEEGSADG